MKINFSKAIDAVLDQRDSIYLPVIGTIQLENLPSKIIDDEKAITPPSVILSHFDAKTKNKALKKYLKKKYDLSKDKADDAIKSFSEMLIKTINKHGKVEIDKLMTIKKKGKKYQIKAKKNYINRYYKGLPVVELNKIKKKDRKSVSQEAKSQTLANNKLASEKKISTPDQKPAKNIAAAASTVAAGHSPKKVVVKKEPTSQVVSNPNIKKEEIKKVVNPIEKKPAITPGKTTPPPPISSQPPKSNITYVKPNLVFPATKAKTPTSSSSTSSSGASKKAESMSLNEKLKLQQEKPNSATKATTTTRATPTTNVNQNSIKDPMPIGKVDFTPVPPSHEGFGCIGPAMALLALLLIFALVYFGCNKLKNMSKSQASTKTTETNISPSSDAETTTLDAMENSASSTDANIEDDDSSIAEEKPTECIIITGAFSSYENVSKMEELLAQNGYEVYISEYGPYTRVGFTYDCSNVDLEDYLNNIRRHIEPKSWYLVPDLYVEYE